MLKKLLLVLGVAALSVVGLTVSSPAVSAAPAVAAPAAIPIIAPSIIIYKHHQNQGGRFNDADEIGRAGLPSDCDSQGHYYYLNLYQTSVVSSAIFFAPTLSRSNCNSLWVGSVLGDWYGECVSRKQGDWGFNFGEGYNDSSTVLVVKYWKGCPPW